MSRRILGFALILLALFAVLYPTISQRLSTPSLIPRAHAASRTITLVGSVFGWNYSTNNNPTITVSQGDTITMKLSSTDTQHSFVVDVDKDNPSYSASGCPTSPDNDKCSGLFSTTNSYTFTVDFGPGTFQYYCAIHYTSMVGSLVVLGPDFGLSSSPSSLTITQGSKANSTVSVTSLNGFGGPINLASSVSSPVGLTTSSFSVNPVIVPGGGTSKSNFTITVPATMSSGLYTITVTASNSTTYHQTTVSITVPDFSIVSSPTSVNINSGSSGSSTLTITGFNGFSGTVSLLATAPSGRAMTTINPSNVLLSSTATSATSMLTISSALGVFNATLTATSGSTSHSTNVLVRGPDFTVTTNPTNISVTQGSSVTFVVTLSGINGFSGSVSLSAIPSNGGLTASLSSSSLQVPSTGTVTSTLTVTASSSGAYSTGVPTGSYAIVLNATRGSLSHAASIPLTVTPASFGAGFVTSPLFIGGIVGTVVIVGVAAYALSRRAKRPNVR